MDNLLPYLELIATALIAGQIGALIAMTVIVIYSYSKHRAMGHIALVATSYLILTILAGGGIVYRIFFSGTPRAVSMIVAFIAFGIGDVAIWQVWHNRGRGAGDMKDVAEFIKQQKLNTERLEKLESEVTQLATGILPEGPVHIEGSIMIHQTADPNAKLDDCLEELDAKSETDKA